ncbi:MULTISPECIES: CU044_2847 family protein [Catenuloplanes]|uniref:Trypsin-co-occurring domain-containing protein n=1 Tax=Catenuloplanes niger TaxID=587534 RepID=A0AAE3ZZN3_9ACTN|nr:CU044_2847 family protein [Catenuloplanes niger]MDR7326888.1 hypothetical protein [Catenuloplanes niger]
MDDAEYVRFRLANGTRVIAEVREPRRGGVPVSAGRDRVRDVRAAFDGNLAEIRDAAEDALRVLRKAGSPDEIKLTFGVKLTSELGAVIARSALEGNIGVELLWKRTQ